MNNIHLHSTLGRSSELAKWFSKQDEQFRIEAVIHDGQWYTIDKWAVIAKVTEEQIQEFIQSVNYLIVQNDSYRVNTQEIVRWYSEHNIDMEKHIVPNNFTPKIWYGKTETEWFLETPRYRVNSLIIYNNDIQLLREIKEKLLKNVAYTQFLNSDRLRVNTICPQYIIKYLSQVLSPDRFQTLEFRQSNYIRFRHLSDFDERFIDHLLNSYIDYAFGMIKSHQKTLNVFLPSPSEQRSQVKEWILRAAYKFDETACVPFSGYLATVLQRWPYDLPNEAIGSKLARFQRQRNKAIAKLQFDEEQEEIDEEEVKNLLLEEYDSDTYDKMLEDLIRWEQSNRATPITGGGKDEEMYERRRPSDTTGNPQVLHNITKAIIATALETEDYHSLFEIAENFSMSKLQENTINETFKQALYQKLF